MKRVGAVVMLMAVALAACASDESERGSGLPTNAGTATDASSETGAAPTPIDPGDGIGDGSGGSELPVIAPELADEVDTAVADLGARVGTDQVVRVVVAHEVTWPNGSLGCPEPGMSYIQALVPGYRIELAVGDVVYEYHGASGADPFLCPGS